MKETEKSHQLPTPFNVNVWTLPQSVKKVVWQNGLNVHIEISGVISVCYKKFLGVIKVVINKIYFSNMIFPLTFIKVWLQLMQKNKHYYWIKIEKLWIQFFDGIEKLSRRSSWYHSKWHQGNPWVMVHSHSSIKRSPLVMLCSHALNNDW